MAAAGLASFGSLLHPLVLLCDLGVELSHLLRGDNRPGAEALELQPLQAGGPRERHVSHARAKRVGQVDLNAVEGHALCLVDGDRPSRVQRDLEPGAGDLALEELPLKLSRRNGQLDPIREEHEGELWVGLAPLLEVSNAPRIPPGKVLLVVPLEPHLEGTVPKDDTPRPVAQTPLDVDVCPQHDLHPRLGFQDGGHPNFVQLRQVRSGLLAAYEVLALIRPDLALEPVEEPLVLPVYRLVQRVKLCGDDPVLLAQGSAAGLQPSHGLRRGVAHPDLVQHVDKGRVTLPPHALQHDVCKVQALPRGGVKDEVLGALRGRQLEKVPNRDNLHTPHRVLLQQRPPVDLGPSAPLGDEVKGIKEIGRDHRDLVDQQDLDVTPPVPL
mmetsp:Transcript_251/g.937  ORF Transcript_251/g.937 Transcript_251/m.937 type:complete len:383 (-) Transcript_251:751-1899(-)